MVQCLRQSKDPEENADIQVRYQSITGGWREVMKMHEKSDTDKKRKRERAIVA